ncbi:translation initiation factor IF-2 [Sorangium sp. So ce1151]|uniref:translation initiation factor IF-2 n=1 Tax=Sorangium sp. So ce1151 TaxID=3133332 RepID=UPI003F639F79
MTLARRLALGLGLVIVIAVVARVAWLARRSGAASTSARHRSSPPAASSGASAPAPSPPRALQHSASAVPFAQLKLEARRPDVFAYLDTELLVAAACTNRGVVAYYDGALHVVTTRSDIQASVLHEYTHHVLMSHGKLGPAWAQEGIAMHVARETWWLDPVRLEQVRDAPMSLEVMEQAVPYTLRTEDAVLFYVQAASMVGCFVRGDGARLRRLMDAMGTAEDAAPGGSSDELSQLLEPSTWQSCIDALMRDISPLR